MRILFNQTLNQSKISTNSASNNNISSLQYTGVDSVHFKSKKVKFSPEFFGGLDRLIDKIPNTKHFEYDGQPTSMAKLVVQRIKGICEAGEFPVSDIEGHKMAHLVEDSNVANVISICKYVKQHTFNDPFNTGIEEYIQILSKRDKVI